VPAACRLGVLALGDSITVGHGGMQAGMGSQSWALWLASALALPYTTLARNGDTAAGVRRDQLPAIPGERYDLGCLHIGVNDVRADGWDARAYAADVDAVLAALAARCDRVLTLTIPRALGLPPAGAKVEEANAALEAAAAAHGAVVADLRDLAGAAHVWADRVHATATGQVALADRAALALRAAGADVPRLPSELARPPRPDLLYAVHYARRTVREHARAAAARAGAAAAGRAAAARRRRRRSAGRPA
jgi:lysophospholipase L1-like esterase